MEEAEKRMEMLMDAAQEGDLELVRELVRGGVLVDVKDEDGYTALMHAALREQTDVVRFLIDGGADMNAADNDGKTALMYASRWGDIDVVRFLVDQGADVNAVDNDWKTALMDASWLGDLDIARFLVDGGADVNAVDKNGKTALMYASEEGKMDVVRHLVDRGAGVNMVNQAGRTAVFFAASKGHSAIQHLLTPQLQVAQNADVSSQDIRQEPKSRSSTSWFISPFEIELHSLINREDAGVQFRAKWLDADVMVKLFIPDASMASFADEVTVWRQLRHPNVIKLYGACDVGHHFFVSEFASNGSIVEHLTACRRAGVKCTPWKFLYEAALGLAYLHERKIVHGNLRGSNILIGSDGMAKLSEFTLSGSANASFQMASADAVFGSTRWQSPERVEGGEATYASDVYSLGLCIVEALTGKIPWEDKSSNGVIGWKKDWNPAAEARSEDAPGPLTDDMIDLVGHMCALDPEQRVAASVAAQMLEHLATKERTKHQAAAQQPEPEPQVNVNEYKNGELTRLWGKMQSLMSSYDVGELQRHAFDEVEEMFERLGRASQPWKLLDQFHKLLVDIDNMARPDSYQNRIQRLSSTRVTGFAMDGIRRRLDAMWAMIEGPRAESEARKLRWSDQRTKQLDLFVSEVKQTLLILNEMDTEEDRLNLMAILKSEIDTHGSDYTPGQLSVVQKVYNDLIQRTSSDALTTTPEWFLPWYELEVDNASCVGIGGFGGVYRARWLDSEVVVKLLNPVGVDNRSDNSLASMMSSDWTAQSTTASSSASQAAQKKIREMFAREVSVWFALSHPHVVRLFGACHVGTQFFACEYAGKGSLDKYLQKNPEEMWQKLYEAALGVQYLHARGVIHGDLKCNNILVGSDGKAKVTDFGLSSDAALSDKTGTQVSGAWQWVAPECLEHGASQLSPASDIYALGMCIIEALRVVALRTLKMDEHAYLPLPWGNLDNAAVKYHVVQKGALPLRPQLCTDDQWLLVTRMCAFDPSRRLKISTVVDELDKLAKFERSAESEPTTASHEQALAPERISAATTQMKGYTQDAISTGRKMQGHLLGRLWDRLSLKSVSAVIAEMKDYTRSTHDASTTNSKTLNQIFGLLWDRLDHLASIIIDVGGDLESLRDMIERAEKSTTSLPDTHDTLIEFTQTAMRGYALHRDLDKLIEAKFWRIDNGGEVHAWKSRCNQFLGVGDGQHS